MVINLTNSKAQQLIDKTVKRPIVINVENNRLNVKAVIINLQENATKLSIFLLQIFEESASDYDNNPEIISRSEYNCHVTGTIPMYPFRYSLW